MMSKLREVGQASSLLVEAGVVVNMVKDMDTQGPEAVQSPNCTGSIQSHLSYIDLLSVTVITVAESCACSVVDTQLAWKLNEKIVVKRRGAGPLERHMWCRQPPSVQA
jgi:hypothetical protein